MIIYLLGFVIAFWYALSEMTEGQKSGENKYSDDNIFWIAIFCGIVVNWGVIGIIAASAICEFKELNKNLKSNKERNEK
jgi:mannose/fructose/N-acetylgalactosamine-specific phosphotransferase system component IIC